VVAAAQWTGVRHLYHASCRPSDLLRVIDHEAAQTSIVHILRKMLHKVTPKDFAVFRNKYQAERDGTDPSHEAFDRQCQDAAVLELTLTCPTSLF